MKPGINIYSSAPSQALEGLMIALSMNTGRQVQLLPLTEMRGPGAANPKAQRDNEEGGADND